MHGCSVMSVFPYLVQFRGKMAVPGLIHTNRTPICCLIRCVVSVLSHRMYNIHWLEKKGEHTSLGIFFKMLLIFKLSKDIV